ncbi:MAG: transglycosylase SLT domain-containing protein [Deltaproteobacteria bacterium]|nr:transglycosylase SLT domain-containing protein [Deltaproteobacteria bacterium]
MRCLLLPFLLLLFTPVSALAAPCDGPGLPAPYAALVTGEEALGEARFQASLDALEGAATIPDGPASRRRDLLAGRALIGLGSHDAARVALLRALKGDREKPGYRPTPCDADPGEVRWWLASIAVQVAEPKAAVAIWQTTWAENPNSPWAAEAATALASHGVAVPSSESDAGRTLIRRRVATLGVLQQHAEALTMLDLLPQEATDESVRERAVAAMKARQYTRCAELFGALERPTPADLFQRALATSRLGKYAAAATLYSALLTAHPTSSEAKEASFKLGYLAWDGGDREQALTLFEEHRERFPTSRHDDEALWYRGWTLMRLGRDDEASATMKELAAKSSSLAAGGAYWAARIDGQRVGASAEAKGLDAVVEKHPDTIYAWWASRTLGRVWTAPPSPPMPDPATLESFLTADQTRALGHGLMLANAGLEDWAAAELAPLRASVGKDKSKALALAQALADAGAWHQARRLALRWCGSVEGGDPVALRLCFPKPGGAAVEASAMKVGLPAMLPFAIMRAESGYDSRIVSSAGARGLMQLMPKLVDVPPDQLFDPVVNTRLGVEELGSLRASLSSTGVAPLEPLIIAGYNGGEAAVRRWLADQPSPLDVDRWAEEISFGETRRYVRRVLGTLQTYRLIYGD